MDTAAESGAGVGAANGVGTGTGAGSTTGCVGAEADFAAVCSFLRLFGPPAQLEPLAHTDLLAALTDTTSVPEVLKELYLRLLRRALKTFRPNEWEKYLIKFCHQRGNRQDAWELERFGYKKSNVLVKLRVLKTLLEYQFVCNTKFKTAVNQMKNADLRLNPLGRDEKGRCYWLQRDHRANVSLYREDQDEETWELIASDRAGLVEVISALKAGRDPVKSAVEPVINEDSNSVGSPYNPNLSGKDGKDESSSPAAKNIDLEDSDEATRADCEFPNKIAKDDMNQNSVKNGNDGEAVDGSELDKDVGDKRAESSMDTEDESRDDTEEEIGEEKEEELMIVKGDGSGAECESGVFPCFSEEIEEEVMYVFGEGSGFDCTAGNPNIESATAGSNIETDAASGDDAVQEVVDRPDESATRALSEDKLDSSKDADDSVVAENIETDLAPDNSEIGLKTEDSDPDVKSTSPSAPLPVTKRFLQNIPKPLTNLSECDKEKLWTADSLCGSTESESPDGKIIDIINETVLENKHSIIDKSVTDASINSSINVNRTSENQSTDVSTGDNLSLVVKSDAEKPIYSETENNFKQTEDKIVYKNVNDDSNNIRDGESSNKEEVPIFDNDTNGTEPILGKVVNDETEIENRHKEHVDSNMDTENNCIDETLSQLDNKFTHTDVDSSKEKLDKSLESSSDESKNENDDKSIRTTTKHKVDLDVTDLSETECKNVDSELIAKKMKMGEDHFEPDKIVKENMASDVNDKSVEEISGQVVDKSTIIKEESLKSDLIDPDDSGISPKKMKIDDEILSEASDALDNSTSAPENLKVNDDNELKLNKPDLIKLGKDDIIEKVVIEVENKSLATESLLVTEIVNKSVTEVVNKTIDVDIDLNKNIQETLTPFEKDTTKDQLINKDDVNKNIEESMTSETETITDQLFNEDDTDIDINKNIEESVKPFEKETVNVDLVNKDNKQIENIGSSSVNINVDGNKIIEESGMSLEKQIIKDKQLNIDENRVVNVEASSVTVDIDGNKNIEESAMLVEKKIIEDKQLNNDEYRILNIGKSLVNVDIDDNKNVKESSMPLEKETVKDELINMDDNHIVNIETSLVNPDIDSNKNIEESEISHENETIENQLVYEDENQIIKSVNVEIDGNKNIEESSVLLKKEIIKDELLNIDNNCIVNMSTSSIKDVINVNKNIEGSIIPLKKDTIEDEIVEKHDNERVHVGILPTNIENEPVSEDFDKVAHLVITTKETKKEDNIPLQIKVKSKDSTISPENLKVNDDSGLDDNNKQVNTIVSHNNKNKELATEIDSEPVESEILLSVKIDTDVVSKDVNKIEDPGIKKFENEDMMRVDNDKDSVKTVSEDEKSAESTVTITREKVKNKPKRVIDEKSIDLEISIKVDDETLKEVTNKKGDMHKLLNDEKIEKEVVTEANITAEETFRTKKTKVEEASNKKLKKNKSVLNVSIIRMEIDETVQLKDENKSIAKEISDPLEIHTEIIKPKKPKETSTKTKVMKVEPIEESNVKRTRRSASMKDTNIADILKTTKELSTKPSKKASNKNDESNKDLREGKSRKRGREASVSQSDKEYNEDPKSKKMKTKQKKINTKLRKKVEETKVLPESSSEEETEPPKDIKKSSPVPIEKKKDVVKRGRKPKKLKKGLKSKSAENVIVEDDPPVRQSRRIAQLKIKEEAQRRLMEEKALRELKEKHKKKTGKKTDQDWEAAPSEHSSEEEEKCTVKKKKKEENWQKKNLKWNSSSGGNESDSEPGDGEPEDDFDEPEEENLFASKSDHEFSPESDDGDNDWVPIRRARTLKKEDGEETADGGCVHCGKADHPEWILLCDACDAGWHASCLKPVLFLVPEGEWFCPPCNHKKLICALEEELDEFDSQVKLIAEDDAKLRKEAKTKKPVIEAEVSDEEDSDNSDGTTSEETNSSDSSSDDEKIYRLRERRQLPVSYRFKEYDQLISSAIKEEYKEDENGGAGNQGRGKDISTIIEADKEEKKAALQAAQEAEGEADGEEGPGNDRPKQVRAKRKPRKLTGLEVLSDDCDDNSDEDFKEAGWSTPSSEAITSDDAQSSSSHSSDSLPLRRSSRPVRSSRTSSRKNVKSSKRKSRRLYDDDTTSDSSDVKRSKKKKSDSKRSKNSNKKSKKKKKDKDPDDSDVIEGTKGKAKVKYGGLSDTSKSSHDWSPAHRTRQRKYNYMEEPNTESEDEVNKPSGKHMDSSDEYKEESDSGTDSDSDRNNKKSKFFDNDIINLQTSKEAYEKQLETSGTEILKGSLVPVVKLSDISPVKVDGDTSIDRIQNIESSPNVKNRSKRGRGLLGTPRKAIKKVLNVTKQDADLKEEDIASMQAKEVLKDGDQTSSPDKKMEGQLNTRSLLGEALRIPIKPATVVLSQFQIEREKKRKEKAEKVLEREKKKDERLKKKEEMQQVKEQRAKEREEKKLARIASKEKPARKSGPPDYMGGQSQSMTWPIPIGPPPSNFGPGIPPSRPIHHPQGVPIRGSMPMNPNQIRMRMENPNIPLHVQQLTKDSNVSMSPEHRESMYYQRPPMRHSDSPGSDELIGKELPMSMDNRLHPYDHMPPDGRKHFPPGLRMQFPGPPRGMPPNMEGHRPLAPGFIENMGSMMRGEVHIRPVLNNAIDNHGDFMPRNGMPIADGRGEHPGLLRRPPSAHLDDSSSDNSAQGSSSTKRRGRGPGKKTLARQAAAAVTDGGSPSNSPMAEGTLTVAGAPQPFRPIVDPPSVITRMPHMMPPPYRGSSMYNNSGPMYGQPRPPNHLPMPGGYRPHHPHPGHMDPSSAHIASPERSSPQNQYPYAGSPYYPPTSTPPQLAPYGPPPPPHGRFPLHASSRSPTPRNTPESTDTEPDKINNIKSEIKQEPGITIKQSLSPTEEMEAAETESPSNLSTTQLPRPSHPQIKHTEGKSERRRIALTTATRYPQGPYAPAYGPYAPQPPPSDSYLHSLHSNIHQGPPPQQAPMSRPIYPPHHPPHHMPSHITPIPPRPMLIPIQSEQPPEGAPRPAPASGSGREDEPSEFGGLVSYFSSQQEDDIDT